MALAPMLCVGLGVFVTVTVTETVGVGVGLGSIFTTPPSPTLLSKTAHPRDPTGQGGLSLCVAYVQYPSFNPCVRNDGIEANATTSSPHRDCDGAAPPSGQQYHPSG